MLKYCWLLEDSHSGHMIWRLTPDFLGLQTVTTRGK